MDNLLGAAARVAALLLPLAACNAADDSAVADVFDLSGRHIGTALLQPTDDGVLITLQANSLPPGEHGFHVHERGLCEPPGFDSAGSHFNPTDEHHGLAHAEAHHMGDMLNLVVGIDGTVTAHTMMLGATLERDDDAESKSLLRAGGTSLVIHAAPDDYATDPAGASGPRIACGVIQARA